MVTYYCNACTWEGTEEEVARAPVCPSCRVGHRIRLMHKGGDIYECPKCSEVLDGPGDGSKRNNYLYEIECPKCRNQYLQVKEE